MSHLRMVFLLCVACAPTGAEVEGELFSAGRSLVAGCVNSPYPTIQDAIDASASGDVIHVCPGTWYERLEISGKAIGIRSILGAANTILDAEGLGRVVEVDGGTSVIFEGLTFRNGYTSGNGANIGCRDNASVVIRDSVVQDGEAEKGGGFGTYNCTGLIERTTFVGNTAADQGGGLFGKAGLTLLDNHFEDNHALEGGGAYLWDSTSDIAGNTFVENTSIDDGGGLFMHRGAPNIHGNTFERNDSDEEAGGLRVKAAEGFITENVLIDNYASWRGGGSKISHDEVVMRANTWIGNISDGDAGALLLLESASILTEEVYLDNQADDDGGAILNIEGWGSVTIEDSLFDGNIAERGGHLFADLLGYETRLKRVAMIGGEAEWGGAVYATSESLVDELLDDPYFVPAYTAIQFENVLFEDNVADVSGGGIYLASVDGMIRNSLLIDNEAPIAAGLHVYGGRPYLGVSNTIFDGQIGSEAVRNELGFAPNFEYNCFDGNTADFYGMSSPVWRDGNVSRDPQFVDEAMRDYHLLPTSELIDEGDPNIDDLDGTRSDIGLYGGPNAAP